MEEKSRVATELDSLLNVATTLQNEIKALENEKNFKTMKSTTQQMGEYNKLKKSNIINVKYTYGRNNVLLSTILHNIEISTNLKGLREDKDKKEKEKTKDREEESKHSFGAPRTTIRTVIGGGGGDGVSLKFDPDGLLKFVDDVRLVLVADSFFELGGGFLPVSISSNS